jgi:NAD(P)H-dependent flavin oxidoreductase YrpB (nitropropane dioxygenase family)
MMTRDCRVRDPFKQLIISATEEDTFYSDVFDGLPSRVLKSRASEEMMKKGHPVSHWISSALAMKRKLNLTWREFLQASWKMRKGDERLSLFQQARLADHVMRQERAIEGDVVNGILLAGQSSGNINDIPTCQELIDGIVAQAEEVLSEVHSTKLFKNRSHARFLSRIW